MTTMPTTYTTPPRWRSITFGLLMALLLFLHLGERPEQLGYVFTAFGGLPAGAGATHEIHFFAQGVLAWVILVAVLVQLRRPATQVGAAWVYGAGSVLAFTMILALADLPAEAVPVVTAAVALAVLAFVAHPSRWRAKVTSIARPSVTLYALVAVATVPLVVYAIGQLDIHAGSGPHDEHYQFGHWVVMAVYALLIPLFGAVAAWKVPGWRFPLWAAGLMGIAFGVGSLGITAVSQLSTHWAVLAIACGAAFIGVGELQVRSNTEAPAQRDGPTVEPRGARSHAESRTLGAVRKFMQRRGGV
jgi:hypothetical protein